MKIPLDLDSITILLVRPRSPENLGAAARAMKNMGLHRLGIIGGCSPLHPRAYLLASGSEEILARAREFHTLEEAAAEMDCLAGTTSREGKGRRPLLTPSQLVQNLTPYSKNRIGLVFGPEREGLRNEELSLCHLYVRIPSSDDFPSLNLAQAVMVICYELHQASWKTDRPSRPLAEAKDLEHLFRHMSQTLTDIGFLDPSRSGKVMRTLRGLFGRSLLDPREVRILEGILSRMDWHLKKTAGDGRLEARGQKAKLPRFKG